MQQSSDNLRCMRAPMDHTHIECLGQPGRLREAIAVKRTATSMVGGVLLLAGLCLEAFWYFSICRWLEPQSA